MYVVPILVCVSKSSSDMSSLIPPLPASGRPLPLKVVVRLLPPTISEQDLQIPEEVRAQIEWSRFVPGRRPERPSPEDPIVNARFYASFKNFTSASDFITKFHGRLFSLAKGEVYRAVAAFAPYQRTPRAGKQLKNVLAGSIEESGHFRDFIENGPQVTPQEAPTLSNERRSDYVSPLVLALAETSRRLNEAVEKSRTKKPSRSKAESLAAQWQGAATTEKSGAQKPKNPKQKPKAARPSTGSQPPPRVEPKESPLPAKAQPPNKPMIMKRPAGPDQGSQPPPPRGKKRIPPPPPPKVDSW